MFLCIMSGCGAAGATCWKSVFLLCSGGQPGGITGVLALEKTFLKPADSARLSVLVLHHFDKITLEPLLLRCPVVLARLIHQHLICRQGE